MTCFVYILRLTNNSYYTGITINLNTRLKQHNLGYSKSTKKYLPAKLIYSHELPDRKIARKREVFIKNKGAKRFLLSKKFNEI